MLDPNISSLGSRLVRSFAFILRGQKLVNDSAAVKREPGNPGQAVCGDVVTVDRWHPLG